MFYASYMGMKMQNYIISCLLSLMLVACQGGINPIEGGPLVGQLDAQAWFLNNQYKSVVTWDAIAGARSYNVIWAGGIAYADMDGLDDVATPFELLQRVDDLGYDVLSGEIASTTENLDHDALDAGVGYCYVATGMSGSSAVGHTNVDCITTLAVPPVVTAAGSGEVGITWDAVDGAVKYYVYRSVAPAVPSVSAAKTTKANDAQCEGVEADILVGETTELTITDDNDGEKLSNCIDYCYAVVPEDAGGNLMNGDTQWKIASPQTIGQLDESFGNAGTTTYAGQVEFTDVALSTDDNIVAINGADVITYDADGVAIIRTVDLSAQVQVLGALTIDIDEQSNESIFVTGTDSNSQMVVCEVLNGALDTTFGPNNDGCYHYTTAATSSGLDVALDSAGRILVAGWTPGASAPELNFVVWRVSADGTQLDWTYSSGSAAYSNQALAVTTIGDAGTENVLAVGYSLSTKFITQPRPALRIVKLDGDDGTYIAGDSETNSKGIDVAVAVAGDGSILIAGQAYLGMFSPTDLMMWHYSSDISLIDSWQYDYGTLDEGSYIGEDCRAKTLLGGDSDVTNVIIQRYDSSFVLDDTFGNSDPVDGWYLRTSARGIKVAEDSLGRLIVTGGVNGVPAIWRLE